MWKPNAAACVPIASKWTGIFPVKFQLVSHNPVSFPQSTMDTSKSFAKCFVYCFFFLECGDVCFKFNFWVKKLSVYPKHLNVHNIPSSSCHSWIIFTARIHFICNPGYLEKRGISELPIKACWTAKHFWMLTVYSKVHFKLWFHWGATKWFCEQFSE